MLENRLDKLKELLQAKPKDIFLRYALALEFISAEKNKEAIGELEKIRRADPDYLPLYYQLGKLLEDVDENYAIQIFEEGIKIAESKGDSKTKEELRSAKEMLEF